MSKVRKHLDKIFNKIDSIAKKGKDNIFEYYKYIDDLIERGEYGDFEQVLSMFYDIDISDSIDVQFVKNNTWKEILFQTNSTFATRLKKMYDSKNVYQISYNIYQSFGTSSILLGKIKEIDHYPSASKFLVQNRDFAKLTKEKNTYLEVLKYRPRETGEVFGLSFSGNNKIYDVTLSSPSTVIDSVSQAYTVSITSDVSREWIISNIQENGFRINSGSMSSFTQSVSWIATENIVVIINDNNESLSYDQNLLVNYTSAIDFLLESNPILLNGYWDDLGYWDDTLFWTD